LLFYDTTRFCFAASAAIHTTKISLINGAEGEHTTNFLRYDRMALLDNFKQQLRNFQLCTSQPARMGKLFAVVFGSWHDSRVAAVAEMLSEFQKSKLEFFIVRNSNFSSLFLSHSQFPKVSWIRKRDLHILTTGTSSYTSDQRFQVILSPFFVAAAVAEP